ncbi:MAG: monovalent cation/H+ antiporter subunit D family protein [Xanthomonadales bacterium]|nr:monovalent cation/H+ antiporter subunit D family protein [Gammaproteobacteria bacterium]MBT8054431.1 monovalent cation/H+ antiporter subunit D family protein [Gammaproteobacteria bacterium]NND58445.1 monovalent cation/H+ antiporter subunit D family protein [Xanthomonadales bacterium]NNK50134.1 monovalent cation/H+ antiporter subunit D family protein [Xanthomonadales bacterium]
MSPETLILAALSIPLAGALLIGLTGRVSPNLREIVTLTTAGLLIFCVWSLLPFVYQGGRPGVQLAEVLPGIEIAFRVEPLGMMFAALASGLWLVNSIYSIGYMRGNNEKKQTRFYVMFAVSLGATMGIALAANLFTLFLFYEALTLSTYPLVSHKGDPATVKSARVYLGILISASIGLLLPAIIWTYSVAGTGDFTAGGILQGHVEGPAVGLLLGLFVFGAAKAAVMPVHRWLPAAMVAPTPVSALLHAVAVVKAGVFTITKVIVYVFGIDFLFSEPSSGWLFYAAAFTIVAASLVALRQQNLKRLLAYSTVAQLSYVVMAAAILKPLSEVGAAIHMLAHAFGKITLFFAAGAIYTASKKTELAQLRGIGRRMPITMTAFTIGALSMIGVPPTAGFVSKWYILAGAFQADNYVALATIIASTALNAAYFLPIVYMVWFEKDSTPPGKEHGEAPFAAVLALAITAALTIAFFVYSAPAYELEAQLVRELP